MYAIRSYYDQPQRHGKPVEPRNCGDDADHERQRAHVGLARTYQIITLFADNSLRENRITSYNVCYTKLLREAMVLGILEELKRLEEGGI